MMITSEMFSWYTDGSRYSIHKKLGIMRGADIVSCSNACRRAIGSIIGKGSELVLIL